MVLLSVWVAMVDLWLSRHFRSGVSGNDLSLLMGVPLGSLWCVGVIDFLLGKDKRESITEGVKGYFRNFITTHLSNSVIATLYIGGTLLAATFSTISIDATAEGQRDFVLASLAFPDRQVTGATSPEKVRDIHLWINPFAPEHKLSIDGFLPTTIQVQPFFGALVVPDHDLIATPTVLFRPNVTSYPVLGSGGWFQLYEKNNVGFTLIAEDQGNHAWYLGPRRNQPGELRSEWQLESAAQGLGEQEIAILMKRWRNPKKLETAALGPDRILCALVTNIDKSVFVSGVVGKVTRIEYIDLPMGDLSHGPDISTINTTGPALCHWLDSGAG
ncbi:hypothetical protein BTA51_01940 [Hahella sp. CCB-MM4]|nr:hypothetical protein BTA51_01940 [Hahella sp. CCB-MM4]